MISVKTANSFEQIEKMEFWKFTNLGKSLNKYLEDENNRGNGTNTDVQKEHEKMMGQSKNMMGSIKAPKIKTPKFK